MLVSRRERLTAQLSGIRSSFWSDTHSAFTCCLYRQSARLAECEWTLGAARPCAQTGGASSTTGTGSPYGRCLCRRRSSVHLTGRAVCLHCVMHVALSQEVSLELQGGPYSRQVVVALAVLVLEELSWLVVGIVAVVELVAAVGAGAAAIEVAVEDRRAGEMTGPHSKGGTEQGQARRLGATTKQVFRPPLRTGWGELESRSAKRRERQPGS